MSVEGQVIILNHSVYICIGQIITNIKYSIFNIIYLSKSILNNANILLLLLDPQCSKNLVNIEDIYHWNDNRIMTMLRDNDHNSDPLSVLSNFYFIFYFTISK